MARILGVDIPDNKKVRISLTYIFGIGRTSAVQILENLKIDGDTKVKDLAEADLQKIRNYIDENIVTEGELKQKIFRDIKRLKDIRSYRGIRHKIGLPVHGQRTRVNARTRKGKAKMSVGGLNKPVSKK